MRSFTKSYVYVLFCNDVSSSLDISAITNLRAYVVLSSVLYIIDAFLSVFKTHAELNISNCLSSKFWSLEKYNS